MSEPVFRIPRKKYGGDTTVVSMRISRELLKDIDKVADLSGRNRNEILTMSQIFTLGVILPLLTLPLHKKKAR